MQKKVLKKNTKKSKSKGEPRLFLGYPDHVIVTGKFSSADDSIDEEYRTPPRIGEIVRLIVDDPMRAEEGEDLVCKVLAVDSEHGGDFTNITFQLHGGWRIAISH
jgi:hypothetical protein